MESLQGFTLALGILTTAQDERGFGDDTHEGTTRMSVEQIYISIILLNFMSSTTTLLISPFLHCKSLILLCIPNFFMCQVL
ncbi:uncharacterized protein PHALS_06848 [Plasmopara halstedii]|uniref:Uncharacterized protein n=1 Tax=Plasmopara halstedii TaxID=4781 RepID=A0A0P1B440_PLAHL|nr:uncharacterized protein PHALS_06848 [Plasmopara halstedii]CEG49061.1 hypothetical protein PHALS_06848 [Plasmopara halstedii]|eukprot:XP_024585430.1 hypothetical protein PHALS_06848 [Plasmopara halstedii]